jgi:hypothetical protein
LYSDYRSITKDSKDNRSNLFIPKIYSTVDTILPRLLQAHFNGTSPIYPVAPRFAKYQKNAETMSALIDYQLTQKINAKKKIYLGLKSALIYGIAHFAVPWKYQTRKKVTIEPKIEFLGVKLGRKKVEKTVVYYDAPDFENIDIFDFWVDPDATCIEDAIYCFRRAWKSLEGSI